MLFDFDLTVPANTSQNSPVQSSVHLTAGLLSQVRVIFPPGPADLVHIMVRVGQFQIVPANPEGDLNGDDVLVVSELEYDLTDGPYDLTLLGWSEDDTFDHTVTVQIDMQPASSDDWGSFLQQLFTSVGGRPSRLG